MMTLGILLFSCSTPPIAEEARITPAMSEDWLSTVRGRIAAQARAFSPEGLGYRAGAGAFGLSALVTDEGLSFVGEADAAPSMGLRLGAWGREGALGPAGDAAPTLGACVAERAPSGDCVRRVERPLAGLTEWWVGLDNGVEQGFVLDAAPPGEGPVVLEIEVSNAAQVESARLIDLDGRSFRVGDLAAWDADGTRLAVWMTAAEDTLRLVVDDSGARYPIEVDPSYTTSGWSVVDGSYFGLEVTEAGDVNGDGLGDVAVASFRAGGIAGSAWVFYGSATAPHLPTRPSVTLRSNGLGSHFGADIASAGDVNGDGLSDLIVGETAASTGSPSVYVYFGQKSGLSGVADQVLSGASSTRFGSLLDGAGDVNGDGYDDIIAAATSGSDRVFVFHGSASGLATSASTRLPTPGGSVSFGDSVAGVGDANGDGYDDVAIADSGYSSKAGRVYIHHGSASGVGSAAKTTLSGASAGAFGDELAGAGDVNADGYDDLIVSNPYKYQAQVFYGGASGHSSSPGRTLTCTSLVTSVDGLGDVNGDGYADVGYASSSTAWVHHGGVSGTSSAASTTVTYPRAASADTLSAAGDVDGDGRDDVLIGQPVEPEYGTSSALLHMGASAGLSSTAAVTMSTDLPSLNVSRAIGAGDLNGDGFGDVVVASEVYGADEYYSDYQGALYVYYGSASGPSTVADLFIEGRSGDYLASYLTPGGDLNGDGYDDLVTLGAKADTTYGALYVFYGAAGGIASTPNARLKGGSIGLYGMFRALGAGDLTGDGYDDLLVSVYYSGSVVILPGAATGLSTTAAGSFKGSAADEFGAALAVADHDGDGYKDVAIGASNTSGRAGAVHVFMGSAAGFGASPDLSYTGASSGAALGASLAAGDLNGDGFDELIARVSSNKVSVFQGGASGLGAAAWVSLSSSVGDTNFGYALTVPGDLNGDGTVDLAVGGLYASTTVDVFHGGAAGPSATASASLVSSDGVASDFGWWLSPGGDVNGDGVAELIVSGEHGAWLFGAGGGGGGVDGDGDGDGFESPEDCDDTDASVNPSSVEVWYDGVDQNCDGRDDDQDGDGAVRADDCDDTDASITEGCDSASGDSASGDSASGDSASDGGGGGGGRKTCSAAPAPGGLLVASLVALLRRRRRAV